jgi:hypothetical protein
MPSPPTVLKASRDLATETTSERGRDGQHPPRGRDGDGMGRGVMTGNRVEAS